MLKNIKIIVVLVEIVVFVVLAIFTQLLLPNVLIQTLLCLSVAYAIPRIIYSKSSIRNSVGQYALLAVAFIMAIGIIINIWQFTEVMGGTVSHPLLVNTDSSRYYNMALAIYDGYGYDISVANVGYPLIISAIWKITGITILVPLFVNMLFTLISIVLSAFISVRLLDNVFNDANKKIGAIAIILTGACCYYVGCGMVILKEPSIYLGIALTGYVLTSIYKDNIVKESHKRCLLDISLFTVGAVLLAFNRVGFCYLIIIGIFMLVSYKSKHALRKALIMFTIICGMSVIGVVNFTPGIGFQANIVQGESLNQEYMTSGQQRAYGNIVGDYFNYPTWKRVALLPVSIATQYLIPFPWNFMRDTPFGYSQIYSHIAYLWYCIGALIIFFYIFVLWSKKNEIILWSLWAMICFMVPAFLFAGSVSRYWLPFLPLLVPCGIYSIFSLYNSKRKKTFKIFASVYVILLIITLLVCYKLQQMSL